MVQEEEENLAEGKIPSFFAEKSVFTNHEVYDLLKSHVGSKQEGEQQWTPHPMLQKTLEYTQRFSSIKSSDAAEQVYLWMGLQPHAGGVGDLHTHKPPTDAQNACFTAN